MRMPDGRWHPKAIAGPGATTGHVLTWAGIMPKWAAPGAAPSDVASIYLYGSDLGALTRASVEVTNAQFRDNGCTLAVELTCEAGTVVTVDASAPGSPETLVTGAVFGTGRVAKVRNTAGATVTPAAWNMGNITHVPPNALVGSAANTADFTFAGGMAVQLTLGGTYLFSLVLFLP